MIEEVRRVVEAVEAVRAIEDDTRRARAISQLLKSQADEAPTLRAERREIVLAMRARKMSLRKIAAEIEVSLGTVQDILRDHSGPWGNRPKTSEGESDGGATTGE